MKTPMKPILCFLHKLPGMTPSASTEPAMRSHRCSCSRTNGATKHIHLLMLACAAAIFCAGCATTQQTPSTEGIALRFPKQKHLSVEDIDGYHREYLHQLVLLDVVVKIQRDVPVVAFVGSKLAAGSYNAHLLALGSEASQLKQGKTYRIEGLIVDGPNYGAYVIYLYQAMPLD